MTIRTGQHHSDISPAMREITESAKLIGGVYDRIGAAAAVEFRLTQDALNRLRDTSPAAREKAMKAPTAQEFDRIVREDNAQRERKTRSANSVAPPSTSGRSMLDHFTENAAAAGIPLGSVGALELTGGCLPEGSWRQQ